MEQNCHYGKVRVTKVIVGLQNCFAVSKTITKEAISFEKEARRC
jgi:hypothetical protein